MKTHILILTTVIAISGGSGFAQPAANSNTLVRQGIAAEEAGDPDAARLAYEQALRVNPHHADARFRLGQLRLRRDAILRQARQTALTQVMLPKIQLDEASFRESLDALAKMIHTESEKKLSPNFVIEDPKTNLADTKISLQLENIAASAALDYILTMAGARARHDEFAIVIAPK